MTNYSQHVYLRKLDNGDLRIELLNREEVERISADNPDVLSRLDRDMVFMEVLEWWTQNGWDVLPGSFIAFFDGLAMSEDVVVDEYGNILSIGYLYYYTDYAIKDPVEELLREGYIILKGSNY